MTDITALFDNFRQVLIGISNTHRHVDESWNCDEWDELSECLYRIFVINPVVNSYSLSIERSYENWSQKEHGVDVVIKLPPESNYWNLASNQLWEVRDAGGGLGEGLCFTFVEFGHPFISKDDVTGFEFVSGIGPKQQRVYAAFKDCKFYVSVQTETV